MECQLWRVHDSSRTEDLKAGGFQTEGGMVKVENGKGQSQWSVYNASGRVVVFCRNVQILPSVIRCARARNESRITHKSSIIVRA